MIHHMIKRMRYALERLGAWVRHAETWQIVAVAVLGLLILPAIPFLLVVAILAALFVFAHAWVREFRILMSLRDDAFPGRSDKLIWAVLLIVLPPVGTYLFHSYRTASKAEEPHGSPFRDFH